MDLDLEMYRRAHDAQHGTGCSCGRLTLMDALEAAEADAAQLADRLRTLAPHAYQLAAHDARVRGEAK